MSPYTIQCPSCQQSYEASDEVAGSQTQCKNCQSYFTIPTRAQAAVAQAVIPAANAVAVPQAPAVPKWYKTLTIMGPLCALLLVIGGGTVYWIVNNRIFTTEKNNYQTEVIQGGVKSATKNDPFVNSLSMKFVPLPVASEKLSGKTVLFSIWETRVEDYAAYAADNRAVNDSWRSGRPGWMRQGNDHPVINVSWDDAKAFCKWLTKEERASGKIGAGDLYRLPTDMEWSWAVGIGEDENALQSPKERSRAEGIYPWGKEWPPPKNAGNFFDEKGAKKTTWTNHSIVGYDDGHGITSPVGTYPANDLGLFELAGNAREWCEDLYAPGVENTRVVRGAGWTNGRQIFCYSASRGKQMPGFQDIVLGFRVVLEVAENGAHRQQVSSVAKPELPAKFDWKHHNELRHRHSASDPRKSMEHVNIILKNSVMDDYMLNILSDWQLKKNTDQAIVNLRAKSDEFSDLEFFKVACLLKMGDVYFQEKKLEKAAAHYREAKGALKTKHPKYAAAIMARLQNLQ